MANNALFGANVVLPSIPGLKSNCEEELLKLMKEIDFEFKNRTKDLREKLLQSRSKCQAQAKEIASLSSKQECKCENHRNLEQKVEQLKNELCLSKKENLTLKRRVESCAKYEEEVEKYKRILFSEKERNGILEKKLISFEEDLREVSHENMKLKTFLTTSQQYMNVEDKYKNDSSFVNEMNAVETEKYLKEITVLDDEFQTQINRRIDDLERKLKGKFH